MSGLYSDINQKNYMKYFGNISQMGCITQYKINGGKGDQVRVANVNTGAGLSYDVVIDRGMDISSCFLNGKSISWLSKNGITHSAYYNQNDDEKLRTFFGGLLSTCGLTHSGPADHYNNEYEGQHGRISDEPAQKYSYDVFWNDNNFQIEQKGEVLQTKIFGENLVMKRKIISFFGKNEIIVHTTIKNLGFQKTPLMVLFHMNFGFPLLLNQSKLLINYNKIIPRDVQATKGIKDFFVFEEPKSNYQEQVFFITPKTDSNGNINIMLSNQIPENFLGLLLQYHHKTFSHLTLWKMLGCGDYVLGIEPGNCHPIGRTSANKQNDLDFIAPQEEKSFDFKLTFFSDIKQYEQTQQKFL